MRFMRMGFVLLKSSSAVAVKTQAQLRRCINWDMENKSIKPKNEKRPKQGETKLAKPKLRQYGPERGKTDPGASFWNLISKKGFFSENRKTPKNRVLSGSLKPNSEHPNLEGEIGPGASF